VIKRPPQAHSLPRARASLLAVLWLGLLIGPCAADNRLTASEHPAPWQAAIVKINVPVTRWIDGRQKHMNEECSGTLVQGRQPLILTAWHCFDGYRDLSKPPRFLWRGQWRQLRLLSHGGSMQADWALLEIPELKLENAVILPVLLKENTSNASLLLAGYSRDTGLGQGGNELTFEQDCLLLSTGDAWHSTQCTAFKGASGGPVLSVLQGQHYVVGIISARDEAGITLFTPVNLIASAAGLQQ